MRTRQFDQLPKAYSVYPKVIQGLIKKPLMKEKVLPQVEYTVNHLTIDQHHLKRYKQICGFQDDGVTVPAIYLAVLAQSLQMHMMTNEPFPFPLLGLVHIRNQIKQYRIIYAHESIELSCQFGELLPHDKGLQFDFIIRASVNGKLVFEGLTTYLSRQKVVKKPTEQITENKILNYQLQASWDVPESLGRRYALISGDFNLIHIHALTAKAFGFKSAIAHGMWTKARALAVLSPLPEVYSVDVWFKLPLFLPSKVDLSVANEPTHTDFVIKNTKTQKPHVSGTIRIE